MALEETLDRCELLDPEFTLRSGDFVVRNQHEH